MKIKNYFLKIIYEIYNFFPYSNSKLNLGQYKIRYYVAKELCLECSYPVTIGKSLKINWGRVKIGQSSGLGNYSKIEGATIGKNVMMGEYCRIYSRNHKYKNKDLLIQEQGYTLENIVIINDDVWIGDNVTILPGVEIGEGVVIGTGSVVTKNLSPYKVYAGNPVREVAIRK
ncbi:acyltransferase [Aliivibrio fischeri]|uniref:acyltransferase n=1 Tax=Aliivibrio fischeri TaxID=668 RepID=UPI00080E1CFD|nr:acyltransferase [Aliivibrio fischeri]OCH10632.1 hypothetical protein A6E09_11410 [Aliivibrio fischeri]